MGNLLKGIKTLTQEVYDKTAIDEDNVYIIQSDKNEFVVIQNGKLTDAAKKVGFNLTITGGYPEVEMTGGENFNITNQLEYTSNSMEYGNLTYHLTIPKAYQNQYYIHMKQSIGSWPTSGTTTETLTWTYVVPSTYYSSKVVDSDNTELINLQFSQSPLELNNKDQYSTNICTGDSLTWNHAAEAQCSGSLPDFGKMETLPVTLEGYGFYRAVTDGNKIYVFNYGGGVESKVFDTETNSVSSIGSVTYDYGGIYAAAGPYNNGIYCFNQHSNTNVAKMDTTTNTFSMLSVTVPNLNYIYDAILINDIVYVLGWVGGDYQFEKFDPSTETFIGSTNSIDGYAYSLQNLKSCAVVKNKIYLFSETTEAHAVVYDIDTDSFTVIDATSPIPIQKAVALGSDIFCFNGNSNQNAYIFDTTNNSFIKSDIVIPVQPFASTAIGDIVYCIHEFSNGIIIRFNGKRHPDTNTISITQNNNLYIGMVKELP